MKLPGGAARITHHPASSPFVLSTPLHSLFSGHPETTKKPVGWTSGAQPTGTIRKRDISTFCEA
jgi:hypothetical protein